MPILAVALGTLSLATSFAMRLLPRLALFLILSGTGITAAAQPLVAQRQALTLAGAKVVATAAEAEALRNGWHVVIAITDAAGHLLYLQRMDGVQGGSLEIAQQKARTSALYRRPSKVFSERLANGNHAIPSLPGALPLEGGLPIIVDGEVIGAIGVSGVRGDQDAQIGQAGIDALLARLAP